MENDLPALPHVLGSSHASNNLEAQAIIHSARRLISEAEKNKEPHVINAVKVMAFEKLAVVLTDDVEQLELVG